MVKNLAIFAALASAVVALPTFQTFPTVPAYPITKPSTSNSSHGSITISAGFNANAAMAMEAAANGVVAMSVNLGDKKALSVWLSGPGMTFLDVATYDEIMAWTLKADRTVVSVNAALAMDRAMLTDVSVSAAGGMVAFLNGMISETLGGQCACTKLGGLDMADLAAFMAAEGAKPDAEIIGVLKLAAKGAIAEALSDAAKMSMSVYLSGASTLSAGLKASLKGWMSVGTGVVIDGKGSLATIDLGEAPAPLKGGANVVITAPVQVTLESFISHPDFLGLDMDIKAGLKAAALGGASGVLSGSMKASLSAFIASVKSTLDTDTKSAMNNYLSDLIGTGTEVGTPVTAHPYITVGVTIAGNLNIAGALAVGAQSTLVSFTTSPEVLALDISILTPLKQAAKGSLAITLLPEHATALSVYLADTKGSLTAEMKGTLLMWLSFGITGAKGVKSGVGMGAGQGLNLTTVMIGNVTAAMQGHVALLSASVKGTMALAISGVSAVASSIASRAETASFLLSAEAAALDAEVNNAMIGWLAGNDCAKARSQSA